MSSSLASALESSVEASSSEEEEETTEFLLCEKHKKGLLLDQERMMVKLDSWHRFYHLAEVYPNFRTSAFNDLIRIPPTEYKKLWWFTKNPEGAVHGPFAHGPMGQIFAGRPTDAWRFKLAGWRYFHTARTLYPKAYGIKKNDGGVLDNDLRDHAHVDDANLPADYDHDKAHIVKEHGKIHDA